MKTETRSRKDGQATREKIISGAQQMFLRYGYRGTSVDTLAEKVGITKGTFFYHFKNKDELALAAMDKWVQADKATYDQVMKKAEGLNADPREQLLLFAGLFADMMENLADPYPGCLYASYIYEAGYVKKESIDLAKDAMLYWREKLSAKIQEATKVHPPKNPVDPEGLADLLIVIFEGSFIMAKILQDPRLIANQIRQYRSALAAQL